MRMTTLLTIIAAAMLLACCSTSRKAQENTVTAAATQESTPTPTKANRHGSFYDSAPRGASSAMPKAVIYKTNGDYRLNVPVTLNAERTTIVSYPDPSDISTNLAPICLADGWLLDRRGVNSNTAFTTFSYSEYSKLKSVPSPEQLMNSIIPDARVTEVRTLSITTSKAVSDTAAVNSMIRSGKFD